MRRKLVFGLLMSMWIVLLVALGVSLQVKVLSRSSASALHSPSVGFEPESMFDGARGGRTETLSQGADEQEVGKRLAPKPARSAAPPMAKLRASAQHRGAESLGFGGLGPGGGGSAPESEAVGLGLEGTGEGGGGSAPAPTRAWFPETFLFEPLVVTDAQGRASLPVKVPDRLTTWRVLALAHSRQGAQAGDVASFLGTLPAYVEPVTPPFLFAGDEVRLPIQVVNTTEKALTSTLRYEAQGASLSTSQAKVRVPAGGSIVEGLRLSAKTPGSAQLRAILGETDAVVRDIEVKPAGRRIDAAHGGSLGAPRSFELVGPAEAIAGSESVTLQVYPGALGFLRSELAAAPNRGGVAEDAYALLLLGQAPALLRSLGAEPAYDTIRELTLTATQRALREARAPSVDAATLLAEAALAHADNPVLARLGERLAAQVAKQQRPDGTCQGADGWTLQRLLVTTADCVRAVRASSATPSARARTAAVSLKAAGAFERNLARIADGYTAAAVLASGGAVGTVREKLRALVLADVDTDAAGDTSLKVRPGVVRADGVAPSVHEATALAVLALAGDEKAPLAELGSSLMAGYSPAWGWGDGRANLVALRAVTTLFKERLPSAVRVTLERDGVALAESSLGADKLKEVLTVTASAAGSAGPHRWTVRADPAVPGLGFALTLSAWVPWKDEPGGGLELTVEVPEELRVGVASALTLTAAAPSGVETVLRLNLPAGVQPDGASLEALVRASTVRRYETEDGAVRLYLPAAQSGSSWTGELKVVPTLEGRLQSGASQLAPEGKPALARSFAPRTWVIRSSAEHSSAP